MAGLTKEQKRAKVVLAKAIELSGLVADEFEKLTDEEKLKFVTDAQALIDQGDEGEGDEVDDSHLIAVTKDGEELSVHPTCLADHIRLGWEEV